MRAAIIGAAVDDSDKLTRLVRSSTRITHTDPRAESGALAVALAAQMARQSEVVPGAALLDRFRTHTDGGDGELAGLIEAAVRAASEGRNTADFAASLGLAKGVSGFVCHTVSGGTPRLADESA